MEARRFDTIVKALGSGPSRRQVLRGLLVGTVAGAVGGSEPWEVRAAKTCEIGSECAKRKICRQGTCQTCKALGQPPGSEVCKGAADPGECCSPSQRCCSCEVQGQTFGQCIPVGDRCEDVIQLGTPCKPG